MPPIMTPFDSFPKEGAIIGRLLAGYGELEYELCLTVGANLDDLDMVLKTMFRPRGEKQRIDIADALGRKCFRALKLETHFSEAVAAMRYCLKIRNQYAHCIWHDDNTGQLAFVELEEIAAKNHTITPANLTHNYVDVLLLANQLAFFTFVSDCLRYVNFEGRNRAGTTPIRPLSIPKKVTRPLLRIP